MRKQRVISVPGTTASKMFADQKQHLQQTLEMLQEELNDMCCVENPNWKTVGEFAKIAELSKNLKNAMCER